MSSRKSPRARLQLPQISPLVQLPHRRNLRGPQHEWSWSTCSSTPTRLQIGQPFSTAARYSFGRMPYRLYLIASGDSRPQSRHQIASARSSRPFSSRARSETSLPQRRQVNLAGRFPFARESTIWHALEQCLRRPEFFGTCPPHTTHGEPTAAHL